MASAAAARSSETPLTVFFTAKANIRGKRYGFIFRNIVISKSGFSLRILFYETLPNLVKVEINGPLSPSPYRCI